MTIKPRPECCAAAVQDAKLQAADATVESRACCLWKSGSKVVTNCPHCKSPLPALGALP